MSQTILNGSSNNNKFLKDKVINYFGKRTIEQMGLPDYIKSNLSERFEERYYQTEAFNMAKLYIEEFEIENKKPIHLLFEMATGSGKTPSMAELILYHYKNGYRNFLFFVNSTTVIDKTRINFIDKSKEKYLFSEKIVIDGETIEINEVKSFEESNPHDINIMFTTIQGLHSTLNTVKENSLLYSTFEDMNIVMLSDEAHHTNAKTKSEKEEERTWEDTINSILAANKENVLLEFTATAELNDKRIREKYKNKLIYKYDLKQFRKDGFSKDVLVHESDTSIWDRALQALLISQYRKKVAMANNILLKPVILFKSNYVNSPKNRTSETVVSQEFEEMFHKNIKNLSINEIKKLEANAEGILKRAFEYFKNANMTYKNIKNDLQGDFSKEHCIAVNSQEQTEEKQILVNSLEEENNIVRAIFAVDMLNEGWDVLNLFDIVRLYESRSVVKNKPGRQTVKEAQLIGRGARNFPFGDPKHKRKYDNEINELRCLEELHYHCKNTPNYISELKSELEKSGIWEPGKEKIINVKMKQEFKKTKTYKKGMILVNERKINYNKKEKTLEDIVRNTEFKVKLPTGQQRDIEIFKNGGEEEFKVKQKDFLLEEMGKNVIRFALQKIKFFSYDSFKKEYETIKTTSIKDFMKEYLNKIEVIVVGTYEQVNNLSQDEKLLICYTVLDKIKEETIKIPSPYFGTKEFKAIQLKEFFKDLKFKVENIKNSGQGIPMKKEITTLQLDLNLKDWYIYEDNYGTSEEKHFIKYFDEMEKELRKSYDNIYLIRNEQKISIYNFEDGETFQPDFILLLSDKNNERQVIYQLFVEPKGDWTIEKDGKISFGKEEWKQKLLKEIPDKATMPVFFDQDMAIIGIPFYNKGTEKDFDKEFREALKL